MANAARPLFPALLAITAPALAGPLNPPPGPITSTDKPLRDVEPRIAVNAQNTPGDSDSVFKIRQRGSYYLTSDVLSSFGRGGIEVGTSGVTLDLSGFGVIGMPGASQPGIFTSVAPASQPVEVRNGVVRDWPAGGVRMIIQTAVIHDVQVTRNGEYGIWLNGSGVITDCVAFENDGSGIAADVASVVTGCLAAQNTQDGFRVASGSTVRDCIARANWGDGFDADEGAVFTACSAGVNTQSGFNVGSACTIIGCTAWANWENGIAASAGSTVSNNACRFNRVDGIVVTSSCSVAGNTCTANGHDKSGAGVHALLGGNRIEGNTCANQPYGIGVSDAGNIIIRNTCSGNGTNWLIVANNFYGPIVNRVGTATPGVNGDSAGSTLGTVDPNANFTY